MLEIENLRELKENRVIGFAIKAAYDRIRALLRLTHAESMVKELLGPEALLQDGVESALFEHPSRTRANPEGLKLMVKHRLHKKTPFDALPKGLERSPVFIDPTEPDFFTHLQKAIVDKRFAERKEDLARKNVPAGGQLDKIMRRRIAAEVEKEFWNGLKPSHGLVLGRLGGNAGSFG